MFRISAIPHRAWEKPRTSQAAYSAHFQLNPAGRAARSPAFPNAGRKQFSADYSGSPVRPGTRHVLNIHSSRPVVENGAAQTVSRWYRQLDFIRGIYFLFAAIKQTRHMIICSTVEHGVARPIWNMETGTSLLIRKATGMRTRNAPTIP